MNLIILGVFTLFLLYSPPDNGNDMNAKDIITLPQPEKIGDVSVEETLQKRRSIREFAPETLTLDEISQMVWAAQGITDESSGFRTAPSAGATFPIEIYLLIGDSPDISTGVYRYNYRDHVLEQLSEKDLRRDLYEVSLRQPSIINAPVVMVITGVLERTERRYGQRALRYVYMEAGHVAQNVYLQGTALGIGTVVIGAFQDDGVSGVMDFSEGEHPLYIMPLGKIR